MPNINITVAGKIATNTTPGEVIVCGNSDYSVTFDFDSEWDAQAQRTARFVYYKNGLSLYQEAEFTGNTVAVPVLSGIDYVLVGVYAGNLITTTPAKVLCDRSILCGDQLEGLSPEQKAMLQAQIGDLSKLSTTAKTDLVAAINEVRANAAGEITDEQVAQALEAYLAEHPVSAGATAEQAAQIEANKQAIEQLQENGTGTPGADGEDGGYYTPAVTQPDDNTLEFTFTPSKSDMPAVAAVRVTLPSGGSGGDSGGTGGDTGGDEPVTPTTHGVVWDLVNVTSSSSVASVNDGAALSAVLTAAEGYTLGDVTVTMGGEVLTGVWNADTATVTIASVTGDVIISCAGVEQSTGETVDTSPVIAQENKAYQTATSSTLATLSDRTGMCITKVYPFTSLVDKYKELGIYDETTGTVSTNTYVPKIKHFTPNTKYMANAEEKGYSTASITRYFKSVILEDETVVSHNNNSSYANSVEAQINIGSGSFANSARCNGIAFTLSMDDIDDSYAYWTQVTNNGVTSLLPEGVRSGDIIYAGKNTQYYGMANIDGTLPGQTAAAELSYDDDVAQNYAVATASVLGEETATDTSTAYGISSSLAAVIDEVRTAWMLEYGGDYRKIPMILTADQHGRRNEGIWNMLGKTLSLHDVSKICNLGDTVSVEWYDEDTTKPLVSCAQLESWCESVKAIPFSKQLNVFGNHDTWYGNYADEGNTVGTRYPANLSHLDQYFRNIYARRNNNNGWFVIRDDYFNVKYVVISGFEYSGGVTFRIGTKQMNFIIDEFGKDDGFDIVVVSHVPLYYQISTNGWPIVTPDDVSDTEILRVAAIDTDALFTARKNKTSGTVTDSEGVSHSFDFSNCTTDLLCALHGHTHDDAYNYTGGAGLLSETFDWFDGNTVHFILIDRVNRCVNVWKLEGDALTYTNYKVQLDKLSE